MSDTDRKALLVERINDRVYQIAKAVPPIQPDYVRWLESDCGTSYCGDCVVKARGAEFDLGVPLTPRRWFRTELEDAFWDGIGGSIDGESDTTEACDTCGKTLRYILTDYGVEQELEHHLAHPLVEVRDEDSYALDRLALNAWAGMKRRTLLELAIVINQAWRLVCREAGRPDPVAGLLGGPAA